MFEIMISASFSHILHLDILGDLDFNLIMCNNARLLCTRFTILWTIAHGETADVLQPGCYKLVMRRNRQASVCRRVNSSILPSVSETEHLQCSSGKSLVSPASRIYRSR